MRAAKRSLTALLFLFSALTARGQYTEDDGGIESPKGYLRYFMPGIGATYQNLYDEAISPILYRGIGPKVSISSMKVSTSNFSEVMVQASSMSLSHNQGDKLMKPHVRMHRASIDYRFMMKLPMEMDKMDYRVGVMLSGMFAHKTAPHLLDAQKVYEYAATIGLSGRALKEVVFAGKTCFLSWDLSIPVLANLSRPSYLNREESADPENKVIGDFMANAVTGSFGKYFRVNSRVGLMYRMENGNAVHFGYVWDYSRMNTINKVYFAEHSFFIHFMFNY